MDEVPKEHDLDYKDRKLSPEEKWEIACEIGRSMRAGERDFVSPKDFDTARARPLVIPKKDSTKLRFLQDSSLKVNGQRTGLNKAIDYSAATPVQQTSSMDVLRSAAAAVRSCPKRASGYVVDISSYFRVLPVAVEDLQYNLIKLPDGRIVQDFRLSMGSSSSPAFATTISSALAQALEEQSIGRAMRPGRRHKQKQRRRKQQHANAQSSTTDQAPQANSSATSTPPAASTTTGHVKTAQD